MAAMAGTGREDKHHGKEPSYVAVEDNLPLGESEGTQFKRPQNRTLAILCCFVALLCIIALGSVSVIEWTFRLPFDIDAPTTVAGLNYGSHATLERHVFANKCESACGWLEGGGGGGGGGVVVVMMMMMTCMHSIRVAALTDRLTLH